MNRSLILIFLSSLLYGSSALCHEPKFSDRTDLNHILESYAKRTSTKFVTDSRVKARVNMVNLDIDELSQTNLMDILVIHSFTAYERDGVVYVLPQAAMDFLGEKTGQVWGQ